MEKLKTVSQKVRDFGARVKRDGKGGGYYIYIGKNFTVEFNIEECETKYWSVNDLQDDLDPIVKQDIYQYNNYETKNDLVWNLLNLDMNYKK
jgi:hypothetical protein